MLVDTGIFSCIIWIGYGGGGVETKSMDSTVGGFVSFTFLDLAFLVSSLTNHLNCSSTETLFLATSIKMLVSLACNSSSSSGLSCRISFYFPFPFVVLARHFRGLAISVAICRMFFSVNWYYGFSVSVSSSCCWVWTMVFCFVDIMACYSVGAFSIWRRFFSSIKLSPEVKVMMWRRTS